MPKKINRNINKVVILNNIRSNENVGSIFRTSDGAGVSKIFLVGYTPAPIDKFGRKNKAIAKTALGAEEIIEWEKVATLKGVIAKLKKYSLRSQLLHKSRSKNIFSVVAVEQSDKSIDYKKLSKIINPKSNVAFIFGNEVTGIPDRELKLCDAVVEIPMRGEKESLNVAVSAGIILFNT
jgi:tRNA G18 (ribose-2'-O)-methylase SpoU